VHQDVFIRAHLDIAQSGPALFGFGLVSHFA
jgi:hypothetical protein